MARSTKDWNLLNTPLWPSILFLCWGGSYWPWRAYTWRIISGYKCSYRSTWLHSQRVIWCTVPLLRSHYSKDWKSSTKSLLSYFTLRHILWLSCLDFMKTMKLWKFSTTIRVLFLCGLWQAIFLLIWFSCLKITLLRRSDFVSNGVWKQKLRGAWN